MKNHYIRLAEIAQEGVSQDFVEVFREPGRKLDLDEILPRLAQLRSVHQERAVQLWQQERRVSDELRFASARADLCAFFAACLTGGAAEFRETAEEAMAVLGYPGEKPMIRLLSRRQGS